MKKLYKKIILGSVLFSVVAVTYTAKAQNMPLPSVVNAIEINYQMQFLKFNDEQLSNVFYHINYLAPFIWNMGFRHVTLSGLNMFSIDRTYKIPDTNFFIDVSRKDSLAYLSTMFFMEVAPEIAQYFKSITITVDSGLSELSLDQLQAVWDAVRCQSSRLAGLGFTLISFSGLNAVNYSSTKGVGHDLFIKITDNDPKAVWKTIGLIKGI